MKAEAIEVQNFATERDDNGSKQWRNRTGD